MSVIVNSVKKLFQSHPRLSNSAVYGILYVGAEFSQQIVTRKIAVEQEKPLDWATLGRYAVVGSVINSNILYMWYRWLDKRYVGTQRNIIIKKVLLDQFVMTPPLYVVFYVSMSVLEGRSDFLMECLEKFVKTFTVSCFFWLPAQTLNFLYVPKASRVVFTGICSFAWVNILCWIKRNDIKIDLKSYLPNSSSKDT